MAARIARSAGAMVSGGRGGPSFPACTSPQLLLCSVFTATASQRTGEATHGETSPGGPVWASLCHLGGLPGFPSRADARTSSSSSPASEREPRSQRNEEKGHFFWFLEQSGTNLTGWF